MSAAILNPDFLKLAPTVLLIAGIPSSGAPMATLSDQSSSIGSGDLAQVTRSRSISARPANVTNVATRSLMTQ